MDSNTLKAYVIEQRQRGLTYQKISDDLKNNFNVIRSRQSLQGLYNRTINKNNKDTFVLNSNILNLYIIGYNYTDIKKELNKLNKDSSIDYISNVIKNNQNTLDKIMISYAEKIIINEDIIMTIGDLRGILRYKNIYPKTSGIENILKEAYSIMLDRKAKDILSRLYQLSDNRQLVRELINNYTIKADIKDIEENLI